MLKEIEPNWNIKLYERLDRPGLKVLMNVIMPELAMLLCELNYTVRKPDGSIDIEKQKKLMSNLKFQNNFGAT